MQTVDQATEVLANVLADSGVPAHKANRLGKVIFQYYDFFSRIDFDRLIDLLQESEIININLRLDAIMKTIDDLKNDVAAQKTVTDGLSALIAGIVDQIRNLQPNAQAISDLADNVEANTAAITKAVTDNTPVATP